MNNAFNPAFLTCLDVILMSCTQNQRGVPVDEVQKQLAEEGYAVESATINDAFDNWIGDAGILEKRQGVGFCRFADEKVTKYNTVSGPTVHHVNEEDIPEGFVERLTQVVTKGLSLQPKGVGFGYVTAKMDDDYPILATKGGQSLLNGAFALKLQDRFENVRGVIRKIKVQA